MLRKTLTLLFETLRFFPSGILQLTPPTTSEEFLLTPLMRSGGVTDNFPTFSQPLRALRGNSSDHIRGVPLNSSDIIRGVTLNIVDFIRIQELKC
jgi:hypothetical protein